MKAVVRELSIESAAVALACSSAAALSASSFRRLAMAVLSPVAYMLSLLACCAFLSFLFPLPMLYMKSNGILYDWSRKMVFFLILPWHPRSCP